MLRKLMILIIAGVVFWGIFASNILAGTPGKITPEKIPFDQIVPSSPMPQTGDKGFCLIQSDDDNVTYYFSGFQPGDGFALYMDPAKCGLPDPYPFKITNVHFYLYDPDVYTWPVEIQVNIRDLIQGYKCNGPGNLLCSETFSIPIDSSADLLQRPMNLTIDSLCCVYGPFFLEIKYTGGTSSPYPSLLLTDGNTNPTDTCDAWVWYFYETQHCYFEWFYFWPLPVGYPIMRITGYTQTTECEPCIITGNVKDANTQENLQDVLVEALQESLIIGTDYSGTDGNYNIPNLPAGFYDVRAQKPGYETKTYNGVQVIANQTTTQDFNLNPSPEDTIFYDDFSGKALDWQFEGPCTWFEENDILWTSAGGNRVFCLATAGEPTWTDYIYEVDVYGIAGVDKCIEFRVQDYYNHYYINLRSDWPNQGNDSLYFCKIVDGTCVYYESVYWPSVNHFSYHLKVEIFGNHFKVSVGDNFVHQFVDEENRFPQGKIGLGCWTGDADTCNICFEKVLVAHQYKPFYFVHITDPHVKHPDQNCRWEYALNQIKSGLAPFKTPPDFVVCSGDLVQYGAGGGGAENYELLKQRLDWRNDKWYIKDSNIPIYFCPGNHDAMWVTWDPLHFSFDNYHTHMWPADYYYVQHKNCVVFLLNSGHDCQCYEFTPGICGDGLLNEYGNEVNQLPYDLDALDGNINGRDDSPYTKIIVAHHPYTKEKGPWSSLDCFTYNRDIFINACNNYDVDWMLCGHIHHGGDWGVLNQYGEPWHVGDGTKFRVVNAIKDALGYEKFNIINVPGTKGTVEVETGYFASTICFEIDCQATVHVYDQQGRHDGPDQNGDIEVNIPGSTYSCRPGDTLTMTPVYTEFSVYKEDTTNYTFVIDGLIADTMNVLASTYIKDGVWSEARYDSVPIYQGSVATLNANGSILDYTMTIVDPDSSVREVTPSNWEGNLPPVKPTTPSGPTMVVSTDSSTYRTSSTDPENDQVFYMFDWGDSTYSNWEGPFNSGDSCLTYHRWMEAGTYDVRVRAIDAWDHMSTWSDSLSVIVRNRGDANADGQINSADVSYLINYLFVNGPAPQPWQAGDANCDGTINSADVSYLINYLFIGGPAPCD